MADPKEPFWAVVKSFGVDEVFVLPEWVATEEIHEVNEPAALGIHAAMEALKRELEGCQRCPLGATRQNIVFGEGNPRAGILVVGEGPGATEDKMGRPFVGRSGKLLDKILAAIGLDRDKLFIANIVKCRPPNNRTPTVSEAEICGGFLQRQIEIMEPGVIIALGASAARRLLETKSGIGLLRGSFHSYKGVPVLVTYHPAALLRSPALKRPVWQDMKMLAEFLKEKGLPRGKAGENA